MGAYGICQIGARWDLRLTDWRQMGPQAEVRLAYPEEALSNPEKGLLDAFAADCSFSYAAWMRQNRCLARSRWSSVEEACLSGCQLRQSCR